jgi:hypothetical protein
MSRTLAYCAFCHNPELALPQTGLTSAPVRVMVEGQLRLLWSEVAWPFAPERLQRNALEFHEVVSHVFNQTAVIPFRLLSVFEDERSLSAFMAEHAEAFLKDLERLRDCVQMECVVYPAPARTQANSGSGAAYLRERAGILRVQDQHVNAIRECLGELGQEIRVRDGKNGIRVFVLTERGKDKVFRARVEQAAVPESLSRRTSGPWPATEFLSEQVRTPQIASAK